MVHAPGDLGRHRGNPGRSESRLSGSGRGQTKRAVRSTQNPAKKVRQSPFHVAGGPPEPATVKPFGPVTISLNNLLMYYFRATSIARIGLVRSTGRRYCADRVLRTMLILPLKALR